VLHQLGHFVNGRVGWNTVEIAKLENSHPQGDTQRRLQLAGRTLAVMLQQKIELRLKPEAAENKLPRETGVSRRQRSSFRQQFIARIGAFFNATENVEGHAASRRNGGTRQALLSTPARRNRATPHTLVGF